MQSHPPDRRTRITAVLTDRFAPTHLDVVDESGLHAGHSGARDGGQTHYRVTLVSAGFAGESRVARSRRVNEALAGEFAGGLHALSLTLRTPEEVGAAPALPDPPA